MTSNVDIMYDAISAVLSDYDNNEATLQEEIGDLKTTQEALVTALWRAIEVMEFAYMNARTQPPEIAQARAAIAKAKP